jgi:hypothetical protein
MQNKYKGTKNETIAVNREIISRTCKNKIITEKNVRILEVLKPHM